MMIGWGDLGRTLQGSVAKILVLMVRDVNTRLFSRQTKLPTLFWSKVLTKGH
jgi:hypothetical protein